MFNWFRFRLGGRSGSWGKVRKEFLRNNPICAVCGTRGSLLKPNEAHHLKDFSTYPELELEKSNLRTLCRPHHLLFGHLMYFKSINPNCLKDIKLWKIKIQNRR